MRTVLAVLTLACVLPRAGLAHQVPGRSLTGRVMSTMKDPSHALGSDNFGNSSSIGEEQFWKLLELFTKWKIQSWFLESVLFCVLYKYVILRMHIFIHTLSLEKEFREVPEREWR